MESQPMPSAISPALPRPIIGVALMLVAMVNMPFIDVFAKLLGQEGVPVLQIVWARMVFGSLLILPFALRQASPAQLIPRQPLYLLLRALLMIGATFSFFWALKFLPIADALAIFFVQPLIITLLSPLILGEKVGPRRLAAVFVGFIGTLIIIRPGFVEVNPGSFLALAAGTLLALYFLLTRRISGTIPASVTTLQTTVIGAVVASSLMPFIWQMPTFGQWVMFIALGAVATFGHFLIVRAYDYAEASLLAPLAYTEMVMATFLGWLIFDQLPDRWTLFGVSILIACALYISMRERAVAQRA